MSKVAVAAVAAGTVRPFKAQPGSTRSAGRKSGRADARGRPRRSGEH